jgi:hypothetical protein
MMVTEITKSRTSERGKIVSTEHVDQLIGNYKSERWIHNSKQLGKVDSLSAWYGLDELQEFLNLARENKSDGIKMYFGVYPDDYGIEDFRGRQTVVLVATKQKVTRNGLVNKDLFIQKDGRSEILAFNIAQLCPPWCGTEFPPDGEGIFIEMRKINLPTS